IATAASVLERSGDAPLALSAVVRALRGRPSKAAHASLLRVAAACYMRAGEICRAERCLRRAWGEASTDERARAAADLSLALLRRGQHHEAAHTARQGLEIAKAADLTTEVDLTCNLAMALDYAGEHHVAAAHLAQAAKLLDEDRSGSVSGRTRY